MSIRVVCPSCEKAYNLDDSMRGKKALCSACKKPIEIPGVARNDKPEDDRRPRDDRIKPSSGSRASEVRARRDEDDDEPRRRPRRNEDDEPRRRPAERSRDRDRDEEPTRGKRSDRSRDDEDSEQKKSMVPILIGAGAGAVVLIGLVAGGLYFGLSGKSGTTTPVAAINDPPPGAAAGGPVGGAGPAIPAGPVPAEIAADVMQQVKQSTAYLRVNLPNRGIAQGSGFFALERGIVITNAHVLGMLRADSLPPHNVEVVINSGATKMKGTVLGVDRTNDLAVLRVEGDQSALPPPLPVDSATKLTETQKVYIFGFPLGAGLGKDITVSTSAISSLRRNDNGILEKVQVNGGMHPGNSGGPVTDARGVVVGVSVSGITGTQINFAIPGDFVKQVIDGKITQTETGFAYRLGGETRMPVRLGCLDPMNRIRDVKVDVWTGPAGVALPASSTAPAARPGEGARQSYSLSVKDGRYVGDAVLPSPLGGQVVWIQAMMVNSAGVSQWDTALTVPAEALNPLERRAATIQFKAPTSPIERTLKLNNHAKVTIVQGDKSVNLEDKMEGNVLEALQPESGKGTRVRLVIGPFTYTSRVGDRMMQPPPQALDIVRRSPASFLITPNHLCGFATKQNFRNLRSPYKDAVVEMYQTICNTYEGTTLPVPNRMVQPQETWPTRFPMYAFRNGKIMIQDIFLTCTYEGVSTLNGRSAACISFRGRVKGRGPLANVELGKVHGNAHVDLDGGFVSRVKLTTVTELQNEEKGARLLVSDESTVERTEGNSLGLTPPAPGPIAKDNPPDKTNPGRSGGSALAGDLAALNGTWQSGDFNLDGGGTGSVKLQIRPAAGRMGGRVKLETVTKRAGRSLSSSSSFNFTLNQKGDDRVLEARGLRGTGFVLTYNLDSDQLVVSGKVATRLLVATLNKVPLRRTSADPGDVGGANPAAGGGKTSADAIKFSGDVFDFVQAAVKEDRLADVDIRGFKLGSKYRDVSADGGVLIGFQVGLAVFGNIGPMRPIFLTKKGEQFGSWQGKAPASPITVKAKEGYVVSGISIRTSTAIDSFSVTFAKLGKDGLDLSDTYTSKAVGADRGKPSSIGGKGALFVGITGLLNREMSPCSLGLVAVLPKE